jgi:hypothetical protein
MSSPSGGGIEMGNHFPAFEEVEGIAVMISPYFSHGQLLCDGDGRIWRRRGGAVALKARLAIWF